MNTDEDRTSRKGVKAHPPTPKASVDRENAENTEIFTTKHTKHTNGELF